MLSGKVLPDGTFTYGFVPSPRQKVRDKDYERKYNEQYASLEFEDSGKEEVLLPNADKDLLDSLGIDPYKKKNVLSGRVIRTFFVLFLICSGINPSLSLSLVQNSHKRHVPARKYGGRGISRFGRRQVKASAAVLEKRWQKKQLGFATFTLPSLSQEQLEVCNAQWSEIVRQFVQSLRRRLQKNKAPLGLVYVSEVQGKRLRNLGQFALHLHLLYVCSGKSGKFFVTANELREVWGRAIKAVLKKAGLSTEFSCQAAVNCQRVKKSARNYLDKYITKGEKEVKSLIEEGFEHLLPSQWWGRSKDLKKAVDRLTIGLNHSLCDYLDKTILNRDWKKHCRYVFPIKITLRDGTEQQLGMAGQFTEEFYEFFVVPLLPL